MEHRNLNSEKKLSNNLKTFEKKYTETEIESLTLKLNQK